MMTKRKKMMAYNFHEGSLSTGVVWYLWHAADVAHALGQLVSIDYSDSTPDVAFTYDRLGSHPDGTALSGDSKRGPDPVGWTLLAEDANARQAGRLPGGPCARAISGMFFSKPLGSARPAVGPYQKALMVRSRKQRVQRAKKQWHATRVFPLLKTTQMRPWEDVKNKLSGKWV